MDKLKYSYQFPEYLLSDCIVSKQQMTAAVKNLNYAFDDVW